MKKTNPIWLLMLLIMLPQFVETAYSPALPAIQNYFEVKEESATLTISLYFIAFALGVAFWGIQSDRIGRKRSLEYGLITYGIGTLAAIFAPNFAVLIIARIISAFGISVGSIVTQTILRDSYDQKNISKIFSWVGIGLSISPIIGMTMGSLLVTNLGYRSIFIILHLIAILFFVLSTRKISETHFYKRKINTQTLLILLKRMLRDHKIIKTCLLIMSFNVMLFSYYSLAPFIFKKYQFTSDIFGYSSIILAIGIFSGAQINRLLLYKNISPNILIQIGVYLSFIASFFVWLFGESLYFIFPFCFIVMSFSIAVPNILSVALIRYKNETGSAGALLGLIYYILIGLGLVSIGFIQNLGLSCIIFSGIGICTILYFKD